MRNENQIFKLSLSMENRNLLYNIDFASVIFSLLNMSQEDSTIVAYFKDEVFKCSKILRSPIFLVFRKSLMISDKDCGSKILFPVVA